MRILALTHEDSDPPQVFGDVVRERGHELEIHVPSGDGPPPAAADYDGIIVLGGTMDTHEEDLHPWLRREKDILRDALARGVPVFGICLGSQLLADAAGASVRRLETPEIGWYDVELTPEAKDDPIFSALPRTFETYQWHNYNFDLPEGAVLLARNERGLQAYRLDGGSWGVQFHPEVYFDVLASWIDHYDTDEGARKLGLEAESGKADARGRIGRWNEVGRLLCGRFLDFAERRRT